MSLFFSQSGESIGRLTTSTVLLWKFNTQFMEDVSNVTLESSEKGAITINDDEPKFLVIFEQVVETLGMELVLALVHFGLNWSKRLDIQSDLFLSFVVVHQNLAAENNETILWYLLVKLQFLLCRGDS